MQIADKQPSPVKKPYCKPELTVHGDVEKITRRMGLGTHHDTPIPSGTFRRDLTFSR
jgi:hypothetical protein